MFSFRKIISSLVVISYLKMILVSSFAMEPAPLVRLELQRYLDANQELTAIALNLSRREQNQDTYTIIQEDRIDLAQNTFSKNTVPWFDKPTFIEWKTNYFGSIIVDHDGQIILEDLKLTSESLEIITPGSIALQNCYFQNLILNSHNSLFLGGNTIVNLTATHSPEFGIICSGSTANAIRSLRLNRGHFFNVGLMHLNNENNWMLGRNGFVNFGTVSIDTNASLTINDSLSVVNFHEMQGGSLTVHAASLNDPQSSEMPKTLLTFTTAMKAIAFILAESSLISQLIRDRVNGLVPTIGSIVNAGRLVLKTGRFKLHDINNHDDAHFEVTNETDLLVKKLKNSGTVILANTSHNQATMISYLVNSGCFASSTHLTLGRLKTYESSVIQLNNNRMLTIKSPFKLYGTVHSIGRLTLIGKGQNFGHIILQQQSSDLPKPLTLELMDSDLVNHGSISSATPLEIIGKGQLINHKKVEAPSLTIELKQLTNRGLINGNSVGINASNLDNETGDIHAAETVKIITSQANNRKGKIHSRHSLDVHSSNLDNEEGSMSGASQTNIEMHSANLNNQNGEIGCDGRTTLIFNTYGKTINQLGTVKGEKIYLKGQKLAVKNGTLIGAGSINFSGESFTGENIDCQTPQLDLYYLLEWSLNGQRNCTHTIWYFHPGQNLDFFHDYHTAGKFSIRQDGIDSREKAIELWESLYGDKTKPKPAPPHTIHLKANLKAVQGIAVLAPEMMLRIGDSTKEPSTELLLPDADLFAYISLFDLEKGVVAASNATIYAPLGIKIGRLLIDPRRKTVSTFTANAKDSTVMSYGAGDIRYSYLDQEILSNFNIENLSYGFVLPMVISNSASFLAKHCISFYGPLLHHGFLEASTMNLESSQDSICEGSQIMINGNFSLRGQGNLYLRRVIGTLTASRLNINHHYTNSDPTTCYILGTLTTHPGCAIFNQGSVLHIHKKDTGAQVNSENFISARYQKIMEGSPEKLEDFCSGRSQKLDQVTRDGNSNHQRCSLFNALPGKKPPANLPLGIMRFLFLTDNFEDAQQVYLALTSFDKGVVLPSSRLLEGNITAPLMLIPVGKNNLVIGSRNPYYIAPKDPIQDLMAKGFNFQTTYIADNLKQLLANAAAADIFFKLSDRFWHDQQASENFYRRIYDHVYVVEATGLKKLSGPAIFSLSPDLLLNHVRHNCQEVLMRGYINDGEPLDMNSLAQLHLNASEYLKISQLDPLQLSQALIDPKALPNLRLPSKPIIFYTIPPTGQDSAPELSPKMFYPPQMLNEARSDRGGLIKTKILAILSESMTPQEMIASQSQNPAMQAALISYFDTNPEVNQQLTTRAHQVQQQRRLTAPHSDMSTVLEPRASSSNEVDTASQYGSVTLHGTIRTEQLGVMIEGILTTYADIEAENVLLASLYEDVIATSQKERIYTNSQNFFERVASQARIIVRNILKIYAGENVIFTGVKTHSGAMTHIKALKSIIDIPLELLSHRVEQYISKKKRFHSETNTSTVVGSSHTSGGQFLAEADSSIALTATHIESERNDLIAGMDVQLNDAHNTTSTQTESSKKGSFGAQKQHSSSSYTQTSVGTRLVARTSNNVTALSGQITATNPTFEAIETNLKATEGLVAILAGVNRSFSNSFKSNRSQAWNRIVQSTEDHTTYAQPSFSGTVNIESRQTLVEMIEGQTNEFFGHIKQHGGKLEKKFLKELHRSEYKKVQGPGQALMAVVAVALSIYTGGAGASLLAGTQFAGNTTLIAMINAAINSVSMQMISATASNGGNPLKAVKSLTDKNFLKSLAVSVASAGVADKVGGQLGIQKPDATAVETLTSPQLLMQHIQYNALQQTVRTTMVSTIGGQSFKGAVRGAVINVGVDSIAGFIANKIGQARWKQLCQGDTVSDYILHKAYHGILGAGKGAAFAALNGEHGDSIAQAALGGTIGGVTSEIVAESMREEVEERAFMRAKEVDGKVDINQIIAEESQRVSSIAQLASVTMATLFNTDIHAAQDAARNAVDNNFAVAIPYLIAGGSALWAACDIYQTYQEHGREAALEKAGVEVVTAVVGGVVIKQGFKLAGVIYPSAELAWGAYLAQNPRVASIAEYCAAKGGQVRDFITESKAGQFIREIGTAADAKFKSWFGKEATVDAGIKWGKGIQEQGMPWEDYLAKSLPEGSRLPKNFKTFDFYDEVTGTAVSAKTLNTQTASKLADPKKVYYSLKRSIDSAADFTYAELSTKKLTGEIIQQRIVRVAIPETTTQMREIYRAIDYAKVRNIIVEITKVK